MIKVSVMYPSVSNARFDHDYYRDVHMPLVQARLGTGCLYYSIDRGLGSSVAGSPPPYIAMCHIFSDSLEVFGSALAAHAQEINNDLKNYTDIEPITQISEVVVDVP